MFVIVDDLSIILSFPSNSFHHHQRPQPVTMTDIREKSANFLSESIATATGGQDASGVAAQLEQAIFDKFGQSTSNDYRGEIRNIGLTLKKDNPKLAQDLAAGTLVPEQLVNMSFEVSFHGSLLVVSKQVRGAEGTDSACPRLMVRVSTTGNEDGRASPAR